MTTKLFGPGEPKLTSYQTTLDVFWSPSWNAPSGACGGGNSYVLRDTPYGFVTSDGRKCAIMSINGLGEARWEVTPWNVKYFQSRLDKDPTAIARPWECPDQHEGWVVFQHFKKFHGIKMEEAL